MRLLRVLSAAIMLTLLLAAPALAGQAIVDLSVTKVDSPDPVAAGANLTYLITVANSGPSTAGTVSLTDPLPAGTTFVSFTGPAGWTLTTPPAGGTGNVTATIMAFPGNETVDFTLVVQVGAGVASGTVLTNTATVATLTSETDTGNNAVTTTTTVTAPAASLSDAAMAASRPGSPLTILGFATLLAGLLATMAMMAVRRPRT